MSDENMKKPKTNDELRPSYDFSGGVRGKYAAEYAKGTNVVVIDPELSKIFPNSDAVNAALRSVARSVKTSNQKSAKAKTKSRG